MPRPRFVIRGTLVARPRRGQTLSRAATIVQIVSHATLTAGVLFAALQYLAVKDQKDVMLQDLNWRRRVNTLDVMRDFVVEGLPLFTPLRARWPGVTDPSQNAPLTLEEGVRIWSATPADSALYRARLEVVAALNYMEGICIGCEMGVFDDAAMKEGFGGFFLPCYGKLLPIMEASWRTIPPSSGHWQSIKRVLQRWYPNGDATSPPQASTH